jgi:putative transposase
MPGLSPLQFDSYYHIFNRVNNREDIFFEEENYSYFLKLYAKHVESVADTYAYALLRNHFHFLIRIKMIEEQISNLKGLGLSGLGSAKTIEEQNLKVENPSRHFSNMFNAYTKAVNKRYGRTGHFFKSRSVALK